MADNTTLPGTGDTIADEDIGGVKFQVVKLALGAHGVNDGDVASGNPLPVTVGGTVTVSGTFFQATQPVSLASLPALATGGNVIGKVGMQVAGADVAGGNPVPVSIGGTVAVSGTFWQATQPVSLASLPALATGGNVIGKVGMQVAGADVAGGNPVPVSGTFFQATQPVSAATLPLPSGASTAAKQPALGTAGTPSTDVLTIQGTASMTAVKVDGSGVTQPVSGTISVSGTVPVSQSGAPWAQNITQVGGGALALGQAARAASVPVTLASDQPAIAVTGTLVATEGGAPWSTNITQVGGVLLALGPSAAAAAVPVVIASDQSAVPVVIASDQSAVSIDVLSADGDALLSQAFDPGSGVALNIALGGVNSPGQAPAAASVPVALATEQINDLLLAGFAAGIGNLNTNLLLPQSGGGWLPVAQYRSIALQLNAGVGATATITFEGSNDRINAVALPLYDKAAPLAAPVTSVALTAATQRYFVGPLEFAFFRPRVSTVVAGGVIQASAMLRMAAFSPQEPGVNLVALNGTAPVNAGVAGTLAVGGNVAVGAAQTDNPLVIGGIDFGALTRRLATDVLGQLVAVGPDPRQALNAQPVPVRLESADQSGDSLKELLQKILIELRLHSYYLQEMPSRINQGMNFTDEAHDLIDDPSTLVN